MRILLLLFLISCGKDYEHTNQCFTQEEAVLYCSIKEINEGINPEQAKINCYAKYPVDNYCYYLE